MKLLKVFISCLILVSIFSCSNNLLNDVENDVEAHFSYDSDKDLAIFVDGDETTEIQAFDGDSQLYIRCVEPINFHILSNSSLSRNSIKDSKLKAIVIGMRDDGEPGIWFIDNNRIVQTPVNEETGNLSSKFNGTDRKEQNYGNQYRGFFGWKYFPELISEDGLIIAGYAENDSGFSNRFVKIEEGKKVAVYWNLWRADDNRYHLGWANVVGISPEQKSGSGKFRSWMFWIISKFKLLFLDDLKNYIQEPESLNKVELQNTYQILGLDKNNLQSIAIFDSQYVYSIENVDDQEMPYSVIGPSELQTIPVIQKLSIPLDIDLSEEWTDPVEDGITYNFELDSTTILDSDLNLIDVKLTESGVFEINWSEYLQGHEIIFKFWTEVPGFDSYIEFYITFKYSEIT